MQYYFQFCCSFTVVTKCFYFHSTVHLTSTINTSDLILNWYCSKKETMHSHINLYQLSVSYGCFNKFETENCTMLGLFYICSGSNNSKTSEIKVKRTNGSHGLLVSVSF